MSWLFKVLLQVWVRLTGRRIRPHEHHWVLGPEGEKTPIGGDFFDRQALTQGTFIQEPSGLLESFCELKGHSFDPQEIEPQVQHFYEQTSRYRITIWSEWNPLVKPFGWLFVRSYCRPAQQFNLPLSPRDTCYGVTNRVLTLRESKTHNRIYAAWIRCNARTGLPMYVSSFEAIAKLPHTTDPCIKVVFPLPHGNAVVFLGVSAQDGALVLKSDGQRFGDLGLYITQRDRKHQRFITYAKAFKEHLEVFVDTDGQLRGDHQFKIGWIRVLRLYYQFDLL